MELEELLANIVNGVDGAIGAALGGMDGLLVEQHATGTHLNLAAVIAEHANIMRNARAAYSTTLEAGGINEVLVTAEHLLGYTRQVSPEFFLTLVLEPRGNIGKARLITDQSLKHLREILS